MKGAANTPAMVVVYGQPDHLSTSYQTQQLMQALRPYFRIQELKFANRDTRRYRTQLNRIWSNVIVPRFHQPASDFVFYGNDGLADLREWKASGIVYWYDALWNWATEPPRRRQTRHWLRYQNICSADYIFAVSAAQVDVARQLRPGREDSVFYLPVGVDCGHYSPENAESGVVRRRLGISAAATVIGYLGYIAGVAGRFAGQPLIEAASKLKDHPNLHFLIVGFGPALADFRDEVSRRGLTSAFTFAGYIPPERLPGFLGAMDICIDTLEPGFHSEARSETKLKQYMAMGRACVATAIGENCVDLDHGRCGVLVEPGGEALLGGILTLADDSTLRQRLGVFARERAVATYSWNVLAKKLSDAVLSQR